MFQLLDEDHNKPAGSKPTDKSKPSLGGRIMNVLAESEPNWAQWKEKKCPSFEKQGAQTIKDKIARRRDSKAQQKKNVKLINITPQVKAVSKNLNEHPGKETLHKLLRAQTDFDEGVTLKKASLKSMSDYVLPVLLDCDPTQGVEEEYKKCTDTLFSWRMLKMISSVDIANFSRIRTQTTGAVNEPPPDNTQKPGGGKFQI